MENQITPETTNFQSPTAQSENLETVKIEIPKQSNFLIVLLSTLLLISIIIAGFFAFQTQKLVKELTVLKTEPTPTTELVATSDPTADWKTFTHLTYKYQFKYPQEWSAVISQNGTANTLFGLNATSESGMGGVEIREISKLEPQNFHNLTQSKVIESKSFNVNGINGYKMKYQNIISGTDFVFKNTDGLIYNIYINSEKPEDLTIFDQILSTFKFTN